MIHVQIASELTATGMAGVRWVLIEPSELATPAALPLDTGAPLADSPLRGAAPADLPAPPVRPQPGWRTWAITGLGLAAALMAGHWQLGPPALSGPRAADGPKLPAALPGLPAAADERLTTPQPAPQHAAPASAAPRHEPLISASLS